MDKNRNKLNQLLRTKPQATNLNSDIVEYSSLNSEQELRSPIVILPKIEDINLYEWIKNNKNEVLESLGIYGAILFRGFNISSIEEFKKVISAVSENFIEYKQRSSPRTEISSMIYTSTDYPADQYINMHSELSYSFQWPQRISFCCLQPPEYGGETPISDNRQIYNSLKPETKQKFIEKGILYVRNLKAGFGLSWKQVFQTDTKEEVEQYCHENNMVYSWQDNDSLTLSWKREAIKQHPLTSENIWFNHAYFFNISSSQSIQFKELKAEDLPFNTYYGDGTEIEESVIKEIGDAYNNCLNVFRWEKGDWLLLDNMLYSHGRNPYKGIRKIIVAMTDPISQILV